MALELPNLSSKINYCIMKKLLLALFLALGLQGFGQMVSEEFEEDLGRRHPKASAITWISGEEHYIAEFQEGDRKMKAYYTQEGQWVKTLMEIDISEVPKKIMEKIGEEYKVIGAEKVVSSDSPQGNYLLKLEAAYAKSGEIVKP